MENTNETGKTYQDIKTKCENLGVSISHVCREAGVDRSILERWKNEEPKTLKTLNAINDTLEGIANDKKETTDDK